MVLFDKGIHEPRLQGVFSGAFANTPIVNEAWKVFQAGLSLRKEYERKIFFKLPNPELDENREYVKKTNSIYLAALNFILLHEFGHHFYGHHTENPSSDQSKKDEYLVDNFAIEMLSKHFKTETGATIKLGILLGALSLFFLSSSLDGADTHPDLDDRLKVIIESLELDDIDNLWGIAGLSLNLWDHEFGLGIRIPKIGETYKDLFYQTLNEVESLKQ